MKKRRTITRKLLRLGLPLLGIALLGWFVLPFAIPLPTALLAPPPASPIIFDRHDQVIAHLTLPDSTRATPLPLNRIPAVLIDCTLAAEDKRFWSHGGVDLLAIARAVADAAQHREFVSGASTITQQLIKISSPPARRTLWVKLREALAARRLEMSWDKRRILAAYLNRLDYGNLRIGPAEAARFYFQKPLADLSLAECALLAGLPQAPSRLNPLRHPQRALDRRATVLDRLAAAGNYPARQVSTARREPPVFRPLPDPQPAPWLRPPAASQSSVRTTLDLTLQREIETIVQEETRRLHHANLRHAAVVAIHNPTREVIALVSSADWADPRGGQINGALAPRSPGSTLKPFTYLLALDRSQRTPASILADIPTTFRTLEGLNLPENYDRTSRGPVTLRHALACSLNLPALRELNALGGPEPLHQLLTTLGLTTLGSDPSAHGLGLTLGNAPVRLLELTNAYATLARLGKHREPILFPSHPADPEKPLLPAIPSFLIAHILADSAARAPLFSPGSPLDLPFPAAIKTGTSSDFHDNWCIGFTPEFTVGVWAGNFEHQPMQGLSGVDGAGPIFRRTLVALHRHSPPTEFTRPPGLSEVTIDVRTGHRLPQASASPHASRDLVPSDRLPPLSTPTDYDSQGRALLDPSYTAWFASPDNRRRSELALDSARPANEPLRIIAPADGTTYLLDPEIPGGSDKLRPVTNLPGTLRWSSETLRIEESPGAEPIIHLTPGTHHLTATDPRDGTTRTLTLHVKTQ